MTQPIRSQGMVLVASSGGGPDSSKLPEPVSECLVTWRSWFRRTYKCGHRDSRRYRVSVFGMKTKTVRQDEHCPKCFIEDVKKYTIFCARCGLPIVPGAPVVLYDAGNEGIRDNATHIENSVVGCLRWDCCPCGAFFVGHWSKDGIQAAFS